MLNSTKGNGSLSGPRALMVLDTLPVAVCATDAAGFLTYANPAAISLFGRAPAIGKDRWCGAWRLYRVDGSELPGADTPLAQVVQGRHELADLRAIVERPDGQRISVEFHPTPITNAAGELLGAVDTIVDCSRQEMFAPPKENSDSDLWQQRANQFAQQIAAIVESSDDAIVSKDLTGKITSWNAGAERLFGYPASEAIGQSIQIIYPEGRKQDAMSVLERIRRGERIDHYETVRRRKDGSLINISLTVSPIRDVNGEIVGASKIARDITDRRQVEEAILQHAREQAALYKLTDALFHLAPMPQVFEVSIDAIRQALGCDQAAVGLFDAAGAMHFPVQRGLSDKSLAAIAENRPWHPGDMDAEPLVVADVDATDAPAGMEALSAEGVRAVAFVPIATSTGAEGGFLICSSKPHAFGKHESEVALSISRQIGFAIERERTEKQRELLMVELSHRVKNTLANVLAIAQQTFRGADELRRQSFEGRILALGQTHTRLAEANWRGVALKTMLHDELAPYREMDDGTITLTGPPVTLTPRAAVILGMAFHELATNASKYGALSRRSGRLDVSWAIDGPSLVTRWHEMGGPAVAEPKHTGFGRMLIERALTSDLCSSVTLQFEGDGVTCEMVLPLDRSIATG